MRELKMELVKLNEAIDTAKMLLELKNDPQLEEQLSKLLAEREAIIKQLKELN